MTVINPSRDRAVRRRYHLAAVAFLVLGFLVLWLTRLPGMASSVPEAFAADWRMPFAVAGIFVATGLVWTGHRKLTWLISLFPLYRLAILLLNGLGRRHLELRPDPAIFDPGESGLARLQGYVLEEYHSATPGYEVAPFRSLPVMELPFVGAVDSPVLALGAAALLLVAVLLMWRAASSPAPRR